VSEFSISGVGIKVGLKIHQQLLQYDKEHNKYQLITKTTERKYIRKTKKK